MPDCFHCGLPSHPDYSASINGEAQPFCCIGCQTVAQAIVSGGLENFYQYRDKNSVKADDVDLSYASYDLDEVQAEFVTVISDGQREVMINVGGIACAACAWLIEKHLSHLSGIAKVNVNVSNHQCRVVWQSEKIQLSEIFSALARIGYKPAPAIASQNQEFRKKEYRTAVMRLGVAGVGMMQVGMVAVALHAGDIQGITTHWQHFLRWVSLFFALPVMFYSASPFFISAFRAVRLRHLNMDVPVSIALLLAFGASVYATVSGKGDVYFDSVSMFTFFLLLGRFLEMRARQSQAFDTESLSQLLPYTVEKIIGENKELSPIKSIQAGDQVWVPPGSVVPCDGIVLSGESEVNESLLTGEPQGQWKKNGDPVLAGTVNGDIGLVVSVQKVGRDTGLAEVEKLVNKAAADKPEFVNFADRIASKFVAAVLIVSCVVAGYWYIVDPSQILWVVLSVLVVTCPCALSLATPAALTAGTNATRQLGLLIRSSHVLESLNTVSHIVFDKTGTLTKGKLWLANVISTSQHSVEHVLSIAAALERHSAHPIAKAFDAIAAKYDAVDVTTQPGFGIEGRIQGVEYRFGRLEYIRSWQGVSCGLDQVKYPGEGLWQVLARRDQILGWVLLEDEPRDEVIPLMRQLQAEGINVSLLSGDRTKNVAVFAKKYDLSNYIGDALPADKLAYVRQLQSRGEKVLMVGDGINDVPVLSGADISIAMGNATQLARTNADGILLNEHLLTIDHALNLSRRVKQTIKQNLFWALGYNGLALPAAALGFIPPYLAAVGMSLSSLIVVLNALRLSRYRKSK